MFITNTIILLLILLVIITLILRVKSLQTSKRKSKTLDVIVYVKSNTKITDLHHSFINEKSSEMSELAQAKTYDLLVRSNKIRDFLGHYEIIAVSISHGILDEELYKDIMKTQITSHYAHSKDYIDVIRRTDPNAYRHFQALAEKWMEF